MVVFVIVHIYTAVREDIMSRQSLISSMISGERVFRDEADVRGDDRAVQTPCVLVLGIGNILWADEGFGVRAVEEFHAAMRPARTMSPCSTAARRGSISCNSSRPATSSSSSTPSITGSSPATLRIVRDAEVPRFTGAKKMSLHQTGFQEVLSAADLLGRYPTRLALIGCQPQDLEDWGGPLTAPVAAAIEPALAAAVETLVEWGVALHPRARSGETRPRLLAHDLDHDAYERRLGGADEETRP